MRRLRVDRIDIVAVDSVTEQEGMLASGRDKPRSGVGYSHLPPGRVVDVTRDLHRGLAICRWNHNKLPVDGRIVDKVPEIEAELGRIRHDARPPDIERRPFSCDGPFKRCGDQNGGSQRGREDDEGREAHFERRRGMGEADDVMRKWVSRVLLLRCL